ncbi:EspA/EspE family type VII secretion system effector, partial [Mycobacterium marinum]|uniref:EspA/EspE family type VII secretion system effector n=1 Tax=Mycobacterium marinum TaxID=1781 RepID=UPI002358B5CE
MHPLDGWGDEHAAALAHLQEHQEWLDEQALARERERQELFAALDRMDERDAQRRAAQEQAASERYWGDPERRWEKWRELCRGTLVCGWTLTFLGPWPGLLGDGSPERGDRLTASASMFDDLGVRVAALDPHGGWRGGAAQAYEA